MLLAAWALPNLVVPSLSDAFAGEATCFVDCADPKVGLLTVAEGSPDRDVIGLLGECERWKGFVERNRGLELLLWFDLWDSRTEFGPDLTSFESAGVDLSAGVECLWNGRLKPNFELAAFLSSSAGADRDLRGLGARLKAPVGLLEAGPALIVVELGAGAGGVLGR